LLTVAVTRRDFTLLTICWRSLFLTGPISRVNANLNHFKASIAHPSALLVAIHPVIDRLMPKYAIFAFFANEDALAHDCQLKHLKTVPKQ
jgi:hypothetical protein